MITTEEIHTLLSQIDTATSFACGGDLSAIGTRPTATPELLRRVIVPGLREGGMRVG